MKVMSQELQAYSFIKADIQSGEYTGILPGEIKLAETYGTTRLVIRKVLQRLRDEGMIVTTMGKGSEILTRPSRKLSLGLLMPDGGLRFWADFLSDFKESFESTEWQIKIYPYGSWDDTELYTEILDCSSRENTALFVTPSSQPSPTSIEMTNTLHSAGFPALYFGVPYRDADVDVIEFHYDRYVDLGKALLERPEFNKIAFAAKPQTTRRLGEQLKIEQLEEWFQSDKLPRVVKKLFYYDDDDDEGIAALADALRKEGVDIVCPIEAMPDATIKQLGVTVSSESMHIPGIPRIETDQTDFALVAVRVMREILIEGVDRRRNWIKHHIREYEGVSTSSMHLLLAEVN